MITEQDLQCMTCELILIITLFFRTNMKVLKNGEGPPILHSLSAVFSNIAGVNIPLIPLHDVTYSSQTSASSGQLCNHPYYPLGI